MAPPAEPGTGLPAMRVVSPGVRHPYEIPAPLELSPAEFVEVLPPEGAVVRFAHVRIVSPGFGVPGEEAEGDEADEAEEGTPPEWGVYVRPAPGVRKVDPVDPIIGSCGCMTACTAGCQTTCETSCQTVCTLGTCTSCQSGFGCTTACTAGCTITCTAGCTTTCTTSSTVCETTCTASDTSCGTVCMLSCTSVCEVSSDPVEPSPDPEPPEGP